MPGDSTYNHEVLRIRARTAAYTVVQLFGFTILFWGLYAFLSDPLLTYYQRQGSVPEFVTSADRLIPTLDPVSALVVFAAGAVIVLLSTR